MTWVLYPRHPRAAQHSPAPRPEAGAPSWADTAPSGRAIPGGRSILRAAAPFLGGRPVPFGRSAPGGASRLLLLSPRYGVWAALHYFGNCDISRIWDVSLSHNRGGWAVPWSSAMITKDLPLISGKSFVEVISANLF